MFKGGTSFSKVYRLIERFSENIDLILDWRVLGGEDPLAKRSKAQQEKLNEAISAQALVYISGELLARVATPSTKLWIATDSSQNGQYPTHEGWECLFKT